ncbi:hypothetical protein [Methanobrevibacter sp.]
MNDRKLELMFVGVWVLLLFSLFDFTHCLLTYDVITYHNSLSYRIITALVPIFFVVGVIVKIIKRERSFGDILFSMYAPLFLWAFTMALALPLSLVFTAICKGIIVLGMLSGG